jgi:hypothetical protein
VKTHAVPALHRQTLSEAFADALTEVLRNGARALRTQALKHNPRLPRRKIGGTSPLRERRQSS